MAFDARIRLGSNAQAAEFPVLSFHWSVSQLRSSADGGGAMLTPHLQDFSFVKQADAHSPGLLAQCCAALILPEVSLIARGMGPQSGPTLRYRFRNVSIASFRPGGSANAADEFPLEEVSLRFEQCELDYWPGEAPADAVPAAAHGGWSTVRNGPA